jgi:hypothetical protein
MLKLFTALIAAGLGLGLNAASAQNVDSDKDKAQGQAQVMHEKESGASHAANAAPGYNEAGDRQIGLEQYRVEQEHCGSMSGPARSDCMHLAKVRYEGWAIMQCELVSGASRTRCYQNVQSAVMGNGPARPNTGRAEKSEGNTAPQTGEAVHAPEDEDKPGRQ